MNCYYCDQIAQSEPSYTPRTAEFDTGSEAPRCPWHWRFLCDHCSLPGHFMTRFYCPERDRLLCGDAGSVELVSGPFWRWDEYLALTCPDCGGTHPSLDRAEFDRVHPWLLHPEQERERSRLSSERELIRYPPEPKNRADPDRVSDAHSDSSWSVNAELWDAGYDERGDLNRRYFSDPPFLAFLGDVRGQRVLDAGSGNGYLCRMLARQGASMVGVENSEGQYGVALRYQEQEPLDIEYHRASISSMPFLADESFHAAAANYVLIDVVDYERAIAEIARVLKPGGRFVYTVMHFGMDGHWHIPAHDSPRREDRAGFIDDDYFIPSAAYLAWGEFTPFLSFHRPLRDYIAVCKAHGLELRDLEEPSISEEGRRVLSRTVVRDSLRNPISYVIKCVRV